MLTVIVINHCQCDAILDVTQGVWNIARAIVSPHHYVEHLQSFIDVIVKEGDIHRPFSSVGVGRKGDCLLSIVKVLSAPSYNCMGVQNVYI